jgi:hypothetical protein
MTPSPKGSITSPDLLDFEHGNDSLVTQPDTITEKESPKGKIYNCRHKNFLRLFYRFLKKEFLIVSKA